MVYLAENAALAMLEAIINFELAPGEVPADFQLLEFECPADASIVALADSALPDGWRDNRALTQRFGSDWLASASSVLLRVPSAVVPKSYNYVFNPLHDDAGGVKIKSSNRHPFDARLFRER